MSKTIRNKFDEKLTYDNLMKAHLESRKNKSCKRDIILFNLKQENYIMYLYEQLKNGTYKHGPYTTFYIHEPKLRKIQKARYILKKIRKFLNDELFLELNQKTQIFKSSQGINFCGYKINEYRLKIRDKGKKKLKRKIKFLTHCIKNRKMNYKEAQKYLTGHIGYIDIANKHNLIKNLFVADLNEFILHWINDMFTHRVYLLGKYDSIKYVLVDLFKSMYFMLFVGFNKMNKCFLVGKLYWRK